MMNWKQPPRPLSMQRWHEQEKAARFYKNDAKKNVMEAAQEKSVKKNLNF